MATETEPVHLTAPPHTHRNDLGRPRGLEPHDHRQADRSQPEHCCGAASLEAGGVEDGAVAGGHAAAQQAHLLQGCGGRHHRQRNLGQHGELREGAAAHEVVQRLPSAHALEARRAVRHHALALRRPDGAAQVRALGARCAAVDALAALRRVHGDDVVARLHSGDSLAHTLYDAAALVAQDAREETLAVETAVSVQIRMAHRRVSDAHANLPSLGRLNLNLLHLQVLLGRPGHGGLADDRLARSLCHSAGKRDG